mmetsp:Transcript_16019/g.66007  ORF Transcript_16019/g.66007 Transcript_16019/m.66007 type:complete len:99 (+) Transcript_16019:224-520(+)
MNETAPEPSAAGGGAESAYNYGTTEPISYANPTDEDHLLNRELEECLHRNSLYESKQQQQHREQVSIFCCATHTSATVCLRAFPALPILCWCFVVSSP